MDFMTKLLLLFCFILCSCNTLCPPPCPPPSPLSETGKYDEEILKRLEKIEGILYSVKEETTPPGILAPLTFDVFEEIESNNLQKELDYYLSSNLTLTFMSEKNREVLMGGLLVNNGKPVEINLPSANYGEYISFNKEKDGEEFLIIKFTGTGMQLKFIRNPGTDRFYFQPDGNVRSSAKPYLCIRQRGDSTRNNRLQVAADLPGAEYYPVLIMGSGILNRDVIVSYIVANGSTMDIMRINALVSVYISEAYDEGINHDIAIAQMCYATRYLNNRQLLDTYNYAGLNTDVGISFRSNNSRHSDPTEGVRAHIQHLKGYASPKPLRHDLVDRRYNQLAAKGYLGTVETLNDLFAVWSPNNAQAYGREIRRILKELYQYSGII
jgi:hypothetical protein